MNPSMTAYNGMVAGQKVEIAFNFKSDAESFINLMRVTHHRQDKNFRELGIVDKSEPKQSVYSKINLKEDGKYWVTLWLDVRKKKDYGITSIRFLDNNENE